MSKLKFSESGKGAVCFFRTEWTEEDDFDIQGRSDELTYFFLFQA